MAFLKSLMAIPLVRYGVLAVGGALWLFGLVDQASAEAAMKYLMMSLLIAVVAIL
jgi:hypothetical protein